MPQGAVQSGDTGRRLRLPYITAGGDLVIPFDSDPKYHWWKGGQSVKQTLAELQGRLGAEREQRASRKGLAAGPVRSEPASAGG